MTEIDQLIMCRTIAGLKAEIAYNERQKRDAAQSAKMRQARQAEEDEKKKEREWLAGFLASGQKATRAEAVRAFHVLEVGGPINGEKDAHHFGFMEMRELLDVIYGPPLSDDEKLFK